MLRTYFQETFYDMPIDIAQKYAEVIRDAILNGAGFDGEKREGFLLSKNRGYGEPLCIEDIRQTEEGVVYGDEPIDADDEIINVIIIDGPVTRDGDGCSYGSKEHRDQILYANTIPQVKGHLFVINTPGGAASARIDYEQAIADCREKGKPTVAWVDGDCCSAGQLVAALCDRTVVMNGRDSMGCIGTMCAFWGVANGTVDSDGHRYIELVSMTSPDKNAEYREACDGKTEKLQAELDKLGEEFRETVRQNRPLVKEEHLTGKVFDADEVMGALVDEIGDQDRAIACIYELLDGTLTPARYAEQAETFQETKDMTQEEMQAAEAAAAEAATQESPAEETAETEEQSAGDGEQPADTQEAPAEEAAVETTEEAAEKQEEVIPEQPAETQEEAAEQAADTSEQNGDAVAQAMFENERQAHLLLQGEMEKLKEDYQEKSDTLAKVANDFNEQSAALVSAQALLAERDKTIETLNTDMEALRGDIATKDASIAEMQATIDKLTSEAAAKDKVIAEKESEIKELAGKTTPLASGAAGVPADNGTGAPAQESSPIKLGMSYEEIRARQKNKKQQ